MGKSAPSELARLRQQDDPNMDTKTTEYAELVALGTEHGILPALENVHGIQNRHISGCLRSLESPQSLSAFPSARMRSPKTLLFR
jgi:hypothetical protein